ncbi:MAG: hypothetical protein HYX99_01005, partial [Chloroflexi bacterium]|nr:hypothetical protein [Chloroflexota bacterium]
PILRYPPPLPLAPLKSPNFAFNIPGGGVQEEQLNATLLYTTPGVPGAPPGSTPLGLAVDPVSWDLFILVEGTPNDVLLQVEPNSGVIYNFIDTGVGDARDVAWFDHDLYVVYGPPNATKLKKVFDVTTPNPNGLDSVNLPPSSLEAHGLAVRPTNQGIYVSYLQTDPSQGILIRQIDPVTGQEMTGSPLNVPGGPSGGGFKDLTYFSPKDAMMGGYKNKVVVFDPLTGFVWETKEIGGVTEIEGLALLPDGQTLLIADSVTKAVHKVVMGDGDGGAGGGPPFPRALSTCDGELCLLVDGSPDKIMKVQPNGNKLNEFDAPGSSIESLAFLPSNPGKLYMIDNSSSKRTLWRVDPQTEAATKVAELPDWVGLIGALTTSPEGKLIAANSTVNTLYVIDPQSGAIVNTLSLTAAPSQGGPSVWLPDGGLTSLEWMPGGLLLGGKYNNFFKINPTTGQVQGNDMVDPGMPPWDITGMAVNGPNLYIADASTQALYRAGIPGAQADDPTTAGYYNATIIANLQGLPPVESAQTPFTLTKITEPQLTITEPASGSASTEAAITVKGTVNDPTIKTVSVGVALPTTTLFQSNVEEAQADLNEKWSTTGSHSQVKWHVSQVKKLGTKSWRYGDVSGAPSYDTPGQANSGNLETEPITIGQGTKLEFWTWYNTEPGFDFDQKLIQAVTGNQVQDIAMIVEFFPPPLPGQPFVPKQPGYVFTPQDTVVCPPPGPCPPPPPGLPPKLVFVPSNLMGGQGPEFAKVVLDLTQFAGQTIKIRFRFDTKDPGMNMFEGWYVDGVTVQGAGFKGEVANVGADLKWQAQFTLAEGQNSVQAQAVRSAYDPVVTLDQEVILYLDSQGPIIEFDPLSTPTNSPLQTVGGAFTELTPDLLEMYVNDKLVMTQKTFSDNSFSKSISLSEGDNTVLVKLTDKGGLVGQSSATIVLDSTGPTVQALTTSYPTGAVSARTSDFFVMQVTATDAATGIQTVKMLLPGAPSESQLTQSWTQGQKSALAAGQEVCVNNTCYQKVSGALYEVMPFMPVSEIPVAVRNQWGVSPQATHLFPMKLPSAAPPGAYSLTAIAVDNAGNTSTTGVSAQVVSTLSKFNINLMPGWNLVSLPLIPDDSSIGTTLSGLPQGSLHSVWYYDAPAGAWRSYVPGAPTNDLTQMTTGKGYWVRMNEAAFTLSDPLMPGLPQTPVPIRLTISGVVLKPGEVPPSYSVVQGWNLVGIHTERAKQVSVALKSLTSAFGADLWGSILGYENFIDFPTEAGAEPQVVLGAFVSLGQTDSVDPGQGYWIYMTAAGTIVP